MICCVILFSLVLVLLMIFLPDSYILTKYALAILRFPMLLIHIIFIRIIAVLHKKLYPLCTLLTACVDYTLYSKSDDLEQQNKQTKKTKKNQKTKKKKKTETKTKTNQKQKQGKNMRRKEKRQKK